jgi:hypothetical protein
MREATFDMALMKGQALDIQEAPVLRFSRYAVVFHFVDASGAAHVAHQPSPEFASFERDLLSFAYRAQPPFGGAIVGVPDRLRRVEVHYPPALRYTSEGLDIRLLCADGAPTGGRRRKVRLLASRTRFRGGMSVLHLVVSPDGDSADSSMNEYDLVKLSKLWEGGEGVGPDSPFRIDHLVTFQDAGGRSHTIADLAASIFDLQDPIARQPRLGTIQLLCGDAIVPAGVEWRDVWEYVQALKEGSDATSSSSAIRFPKEETHHRAIKGVAGILQGLLDFDRIGPSEIADVLGTTQVSDGALIGIHKGTLLSMSETDRAYDAAPAVGVSPYLLTPQAVLAHNEESLREASEAAQMADSGTMRALTSSRRKMHLALNRYLLPNVFHYSTERMIFDIGMTSRGLTDQERALRAALAELTAELDTRIADRRRIAEDVISGLLLVLSGVSLKDVLPLSLVLPLLGAAGGLYVYWRLRT